MNIKQAFLSMIRAFPGGWDSIAPALGLTRDALENRIYERKGQGVSVDTAMQLQKFSGTTHFAEAVATESGGTFVKLPEIGHIENDAIQSKFNEVYAEVGMIFAAFTTAVEDGLIDDKEEAKIRALGEDMHRKTEHLLGLMFKVYCKNSKTVRMTASNLEAANG